MTHRDFARMTLLALCGRNVFVSHLTMRDASRRFDEYVRLLGRFEEIGGWRAVRTNGDPHVRFACRGSVHFGTFGHRLDGMVEYDADEDYELSERETR